MVSSVHEATVLDEQLVERFRGGDRRAFDVLVERYRRPVYNAALRVTCHREDAREVAQAVFLKVLEHIDDYDPSHRFFSWIYRIALNEAVDVLRRRQREQPLDDDFDAPGGDDPHARFETAETALRVRRALRALSVDDRTVLTLRHYAEFGYRDIAQILAIDEKTVKSRLFEARRRMALRLEALAGVH